MKSSYDHYKIRHQLGAGKLGRVYLAEDTKLGRDVAFKVLYAEALGSRRDVKRFVREARTVHGINHPNIGDVYDVGKTESSCYVVSEFFRGETLRERLERGQIDIREALDIAIQVASALKETHRARIVHREIKPENIRLLPGGQVKVTDFGLAKLTGKSIKRGGYKPLIGAEGKLVRSISYMSPEQVRGFAIDRRSDIWGLGALLYEMVSGQPPFDATTTTNVMYSILKGEPRPLTLVPKDLEHIVTRALNKSRRRRYQTAKDMAEDLERVRAVLSEHPAKSWSDGELIIVDDERHKPRDFFARRWFRRLAGTSRELGEPASTTQGEGSIAEAKDAHQVGEEGLVPIQGAGLRDSYDISGQAGAAGPEARVEAMVLTSDSNPLFINLWIEDKQGAVLSLPARLTSNESYEFYFAIEARERIQNSVSEQFIETEELKKAPVTKVLIQVRCSFLQTKSQKPYVFRQVNYYSGIGFPPEAFKLKPMEPGRFNLTARLIVKGEILYREVLPLEVVSVSKQVSNLKSELVSVQGA